MTTCSLRAIETDVGFEISVDVNTCHKPVRKKATMFWALIWLCFYVANCEISVQISDKLVFAHVVS